MPIAAAAPKPKTPARKTPAAKAGPPPSQNEARKNGLIGYGQIAQLLFGLRGMHADAETVRMYGPDLCGAVADMADTDENIAHGVDLLMQGGPYTALLAAAVPMFMQFAANHKRIEPDAMPGLESPELLANRYRDRLRRVREQAEQEQRDYEEAAMAAAREQGRLADGEVVG